MLGIWDFLCYTNLESMDDTFYNVNSIMDSNCFQPNVIDFGFGTHNKHFIRLSCDEYEIITLPVGLLKKILFLYIENRYTPNQEVDPSMISDHELHNDMSEISKIQDAYTNCSSSEDSHTVLFKRLDYSSGILQKIYDSFEAKIMITSCATFQNSRKEQKCCQNQSQNVFLLLRNGWVSIKVEEKCLSDVSNSSCHEYYRTILNVLKASINQAIFKTNLYKCTDRDSGGNFVCKLLKKNIWLREEDLNLCNCILDKSILETSDFLNSTFDKRLSILSDTMDTESSTYSIKSTVVGNPSQVFLNVMHIEDAPRPTLEISIINSKRVRDLANNVYTVYTILVKHGRLQWTITRRYTDFLVTHQGITSSITEVRLPTLPPKKWWNNFNEEFIAQRARDLENYLCQMLENTLVAESISMLSFLGVLSTTWKEHETTAGRAREVVHLKALRRYVTPGDIIMFRCIDRLSGIQRSMTGSEWDHVAMVVSSKDAIGLMLLEATAEGVTVSPLVNRLRAYSSCFTRYIALRKLNTPDIDMETRKRLLEDFVEEVNGKPYSLSVSKFLTSNTSKDRLDDFFCSELIASALKKLELIDSTTPASSFWPGCFGMDRNVDEILKQKNASLGQEIVIDCRLLEVGRAKKLIPGSIESNAEVRVNKII